MVQTQHRRAGLGMPTAEPHIRSTALVLTRVSRCSSCSYITWPFVFTPWQGTFPAQRQHRQCGEGLPCQRSQRCPPADLHLCPRLLPIWPTGQGAGHSKTSPSLLPVMLGSPGSAHVHITSLLLTPCPQHQPRTLARSSALHLAVLWSTSTTKGQLHPRVPRGAARRDAAGRG